MINRVGVNALIHESEGACIVLGLDGVDPRHLHLVPMGLIVSVKRDLFQQDGDRMVSRLDKLDWLALFGGVELWRGRRRNQPQAQAPSIRAGAWDGALRLLHVVAITANAVDDRLLNPAQGRRRVGGRHCGGAAGHQLRFERATSHSSASAQLSSPRKRDSMISSPASTSRDRSHSTRASRVWPRGEDGHSRIACLASASESSASPKISLALARWV